MTLWVRNHLLDGSFLLRAVSTEVAGAEDPLLRWHLHSCLDPWCSLAPLPLTPHLLPSLSLCPCLSFSVSVCLCLCLSLSHHKVAHPLGPFWMASSSLSIVVLGSLSFKRWEANYSKLFECCTYTWHSINSSVFYWSKETQGLLDLRG